MKRIDIIKKLKKLGFEMIEGGKHTGIYINGIRVSTLSRQNEIQEKMVKIIEKQIGMKLR